jgi:hypothetical protein
MLRKSWRTRWRLAVAAGAALVTFALGAAVAPLAGEEPPDDHCRLEVVAYEDGSASLYCSGARHRFAVVDAESGRIEILESGARRRH